MSIARSDKSSLRYQDITVEIVKERWTSTYVSLNKLIGDRKVVDVLGHIGSPWGNDPQFMAFHLLLDDGSELPLQGEHDEVYVHDYTQKILPDEETMERLYKEGPDYEDDDD